MPNRFARAAAFLAAIALLILPHASALADGNAADFETFTLGDVNGQGGWTSGHGSSFCPVYDVAVVSNTYGYPSLGAQSLRISNAITCGSYNDMTFSKSLTDEAGETAADTSVYSGGTRQPYLEAQWDFASTQPGAEQPGLSVVASADRGDPGRMTWLQMADTPTGLQLNFEDYQHSIMDFVLTPVASNIDRTVSHTVKLTVQFIDGPGNDVVKVYLDGVLVHTGTTWEDYYRDFAGGIPHPVDSIMFRTAGTAAPANSGKGFLIDNFTSFSGPVPLPPATLHVIKHVINNNAGTTPASGFTLHVQQAGSDVSGSPAPGQESPGNAYVLAPGAYMVSENAPVEYVQSFSGDCDVNGAVNLASGDNKVCEIINDDAVPTGGGGSHQPATITVIKHVINDDGGTKTVPDFSLFVNGTAVVSGTANNFPAPAPAYTVTETGDAQYEQSFSGDCDANGRLALSPGENAVCVITNDDVFEYVFEPASGGQPTNSVPPVIEVLKTPEPLNLPNGPGPVTFTYTVRNSGTVPMTDVTVTEDSCSSVAYVSGDVNGDHVLDLTETWTYRCSTTLTATHTNTVIATGWADGVSATDLATATVVVGASTVPPLIHVTKIPSPLTFSAGGGTVIYTEKISNPGTVSMSNIQITDDTCAPVTYLSGDVNGDRKLDTSETWTYTCQTRITKTTANTAVASGDANGQTARDFAVAVVIVAPFTSAPYGVASALASALTINDALNLGGPVANAHCVSGSLMKLADDSNASTQSDSTIYYCGSDGNRHVFPDVGTYFSWYRDFANVQIISADVLASIPLAGNVTWRPGSRLLKIESDPKVYAVADGGVLRWVTTEDVARALYGPGWSTLVSDVPVSLFTSYRIGLPIALTDVTGSAQACTTPVIFTEYLALGTTDAEVLRLQKLLQCLGFFPADIAPNGNFGPVTQAAVTKFQTAHGITPAGNVGPATRAALNTYAL